LPNTTTPDTSEGEQTELSANQFSIEHEVGGEDRGEQLAAHYSEMVARQWGTPEGRWWP